MRINDENTTDYGLLDDQCADRVTATEIIDGVQHIVVLEQDDSGCYREVILEPLALRERERVFQTVS